MSKKNIDHSVESRVCFEQLEEWVREQIQFYVQELLEDEVTQLLGRRKNERRREVDASGGYRNGYGKERRLTMSCGTIKLRRPRVRDLEERFESRVLPLFAKRTREVRDFDSRTLFTWSWPRGFRSGLERAFRGKKRRCPQHRSPVETEVAGGNGGLAEPSAG